MISEQLSALPLRLNGVRSTIEFIATSHRPPQAEQNGDTTQPSFGPPLPLEALQQASKLLSSIPRAMSADIYFSKIAPQLLNLLDSREEPALSKTAAFIITNGILSKRSIGAPGTIGWALLADPILQAINPTVVTGTHKREAGFIMDDAIESALVSQSDLELALNRLSMLILSHPSPGLTGRLVQPLLLVLWALANFRGSSFTATEVSKAAFALINQFLNLVGTAQHLCFLANNLRWDGPKDWTVGPGEAGGIAIRKRNNFLRPLAQDTELERELTQMNRRIQAFCRLLVSNKTSDADLSALFHHLFGQLQGREKQLSNELGIEQNPLDELMRVKLLQALVETFSDQMNKIPDQLVALVHGIIQQYVQHMPGTQASGPRSVLTDLANIVGQPKAEEHLIDEAEHTGEDALMIALSLLNSFAISAERKPDPTISSMMQAIQSYLMKIETASTIDEALAAQIKTAITLLTTKIQDTTNPSPKVDADSALDVQQTMNLIMIDIASELPPVRRSALLAMQALISSPDIPLDTPQLSLILLEIIRTDNEEYVYLAAVQTTVQLAMRRGLGFIARLLTDSFQDVEEQTGVDGRLHIGEALASLVDGLAETEIKDMRSSDVLCSMTETLIEVTARRGQRRREVLERQREERLQRRKHKEAERAWGGEIPDEPMQDENDEYEDLAPMDKQRRLRDLEAVESIVKGWEDTGYEEDVRIRASALSILNRILENCVPDIQDTSLTSNTIELCLSILSLELDPSKAILRRAAALALFGLLKGIDAQLGSSQASVSTQLIDGDKWMKAEKVLRWVVDTDFDDLTVGHSETVLEGLDAVRMKLIANAVSSAPQDQSLDGKLRGLTVDIDLDGDTVNQETDQKMNLAMRKIEEIE
jgi:hypothetical protein